MLTFKQFLVEWSHTAKGVNAYLIRRGYKKLGNGVDQTAWLDKDGTVLKIFGASEDGRLDHFSNGHKMFIQWEKYCKKNSKNPFLPKYYGWETFDYSERKYLQIKTERMKPLPHDIGLALQEVLSYYAVNRSKKIRDSSKIGIKNLDPRVLDNPDYGTLKSSKMFEAGVAKLAMLLGEDGFDLLYKTIVDIGIMGRKNDWGIDLHSGNFMMRNDGTPVITDPFVVG